MNRDTLLKKYGDKIKLKKEAGLLRETDFKEITITDEFSGKTNSSILKSATVRKKNLDGDWEESFNSVEYQMRKIMELVEFDGKKLPRAEVERLESSFLTDLLTLASPVISEQKEDAEN